MKECFKCKIFKPLSEFYKHSRMADGHLNKCKECTKKDSHKHRKENLEAVLEYDRNRPNREDRVKQTTERISRLCKEDKEFFLKVKQKTADWRKRYPQKYKAQCAANNAVRDGRLIKKTNCEHCGSDGKLQKHHWSYEEEHWLDVIWLCTNCHGREHARLNELGRDPDNVSDYPSDVTT